MRRLLRVTILAGTAGALVAAGNGIAQAHALVRSSDPADGALLQSPPGRVTITFTEPPDPTLSSIRVLDAAGKNVDRGQAGPVAGRAPELTVPVLRLGRGVYAVAWRAVSRVDGHVTAGSFSFGVGVSPAGAALPAAVTSAQRTPSPSPLQAAGRWGYYWGLALLLSAGLLGLAVFRGRFAPPPAFLAMAWGIGAAGLLLMVVAERSTVGVSFGHLFSSAAGRELLWQGIGLAATGGAVVLAVGRPGRTALWSLVVAAGGTMLLHAQAGHAGASGRFEWFNVGVQWVHLLAVGTWVGGLAWLLLGTRGAPGGERAGFVRRFSRLAGVALAVVAATGSLRALDEVGGPAHWRRLFDSSFGLTLLAKVGLFAALVALGARNRYVNVPRIVAGDRGMASLRRTVGAEVLVAAGVLGVTGVLTQLPPAATIAQARSGPPAARIVVAEGSDFATSVRVRLTASPGTAGPNAFQARVADYDTGRPVPATGVSLAFRLPVRPDLGTPSLSLSRTAPGLWAGNGTALSTDGRWEVSVLVQEPTTAVTVPLRLQTGLPPQRISVQPGGPGQPTLYTVSLAGGDSLQTYVDPGRSGRNTVHFTFFQASGNELSIAKATAVSATPAGVEGPLPLIRFDAGHFVANTTLTPGRWRFQIQATTPDGRALAAYFQPPIAG